MNKVVKVSIGNTAFTLDEEAYKVLNNYLNALNAHYRNNENGSEIVDGIEERIAELLLEKCGENKIISVEMAKEVTEILGQPEVIDEDCGEKNKETNNYSGKKKFYRDPTNKIFGGVCSGLGGYFERDASLFRIIFVLATLLFSIPSWGIGGGCFILLYILLWIIFPEAKTVEDRCRMKGESNTVDSIEKSVKTGAKAVEDEIKNIQKNNPNFWTIVGNIIVKCIGFIFTIVGLSGIVALAFLFIGVEFWNFVIPFASFNSFFALAGNIGAATVLLKILILLVCFIPFIGFLYGGIQMLFGFKSPKWRPGLIIFLIWVASVICMFCIGFSTYSDYWKTEQRHLTNSITLESDTLYLRFDNVDKMKDCKVWIDADKKDYSLVYFDDTEKNNPKITQYPFIKLRKGDRENNKIRVNTHFFPETMSLSEIKSFDNTEFYNFDGKTLTLMPISYTKESRVKEMGREVELFIDDNVVVIVKDPVYHNFENDFEYSDVRFLRRH